MEQAIVYVSHAPEDAAAANRLKGALAAQGVAVSEAMPPSTVVLACVGASFAADEIARSVGKRVIAVRLGSGQIPMALNGCVVASTAEQIVAQIAPPANDLDIKTQNMSSPTIDIVPTPGAKTKVVVEQHMVADKKIKIGTRSKR